MLCRWAELRPIRGLIYGAVTDWPLFHYWAKWFSGLYRPVPCWSGLVRPVAVSVSIYCTAKSEPGNTQENYTNKWLTANRLIATHHKCVCGLQSLSVFSSCLSSKRVLFEHLLLKQTVLRWDNHINKSAAQQGTTQITTEQFYFLSFCCFNTGHSNLSSRIQVFIL